MRKESACNAEEVEDEGSIPGLGRSPGEFNSVAQLCPTLQPQACQASLVHHQLLEFTQTHVHRVGDAVQPSHPLLSPFPPALNLSQYLGLFQ